MPEFPGDGGGRARRGRLGVKIRQDAEQARAARALQEDLRPQTVCDSMANTTGIWVRRPSAAAVNLALLLSTPTTMPSMFGLRWSTASSKASATPRSSLRYFSQASC